MTCTNSYYDVCTSTLRFNIMLPLQVIYDTRYDTTTATATATATTTI